MYGASLHTRYQAKNLCDLSHLLSLHDLELLLSLFYLQRNRLIKVRS